MSYFVTKFWWHILLIIYWLLPLKRPVVGLGLVEGWAVPALEGIGCVVRKRDTREQRAEGEMAAMALSRSRGWSHGRRFCSRGFSGFSVQLLKWCIVVVFLHKDELIYLVFKIELCTCECSQCSAAKWHHAGACTGLSDVTLQATSYNF